ncbi:MAG: hypothetical protein ACREEL_14580, partial [Stellaceae bacterium]
MLDGIILSLEVRRLERQRRRILKSFAKDIREARAQLKERDEIDRLESDERFEIGEVDDEIYQLQNNYLLRLARHYLLPIPEFKLRIPAKSPTDSETKSPGVPIDVARARGVTGGLVFASKIGAVK